MLKTKMYVHTPTEEIFTATEKFLCSSGYSWGIGDTLSTFWSVYKEDTVIFCSFNRNLTYGDLQYARNVKIKPLDFALITEGVIKVGSYEVEFFKNGDIEVGCEFVEKDLLEKIYKKSLEMKNGHS